MSIPDRLHLEADALLDASQKAGAELAKLRAKLETSEAACAVMREALQKHCTGVRLTHCTDPQHGDSTWDHECDDGSEPCPHCSFALSSGAGRALLEELKNLRIKLYLVDEPVYSRRKLEEENVRLREAIEWARDAVPATSLDERMAWIEELKKRSGL